MININSERVRKIFVFLFSLLLLLSLLFNPFFIEKTFSPDGKFDFFWIYLILFMIEIFLFTLFLAGFLVSINKIFYKKIIGLFSTFVMSKKELLIGLSLLLFSIIFSIFLIEGVTRVYLFNFDESFVDISDYNMSPEYTFDLFYGKDYYPNTTYETNRKLSNGSYVFNNRFTTDRFNRRTPNVSVDINSKYTNNSLLMFGCSIIEGFGLSDNETVAYYMNKYLNSTLVYNYAKTGFSTVNMLAMLEKKNLSQEVFTDNFTLIYFYLPEEGFSGHISRNTGKINVPWAYYYPYYNTENGTVKRDRFFFEVHSIQARMYTFVNKWFRKSYFFKRFVKQIPSLYSDYDVELTKEIILKSKKIAFDKYGADLIVISHPMYKVQDVDRKLFSKLDENGIEVVEFNDLSFNSDMKIKYDSHPNADFNMLFSRVIIDYMEVN